MGGSYPGPPQNNNQPKVKPLAPDPNRKRSARGANKTTPPQD